MNMVTTHTTGTAIPTIPNHHNLRRTQILCIKAAIPNTAVQNDKKGPKQNMESNISLVTETGKNHGASIMRRNVLKTKDAIARSEVFTSSPWMFLSVSLISPSSENASFHPTIVTINAGCLNLLIDLADFLKYL